MSKMSEQSPFSSAVPSGADSLVVSIVQITEPMLEFANMPYAAGLLQAYVQSHAPGDYLFLLPLFERVPIADAAARLSLARVVGFSTYVWNMQYSLALAARLKAQDPERLIVFGGPQVPDRCADFMHEHPFIDLCVHGEGEAVWLEVLRRYRAPGSGPGQAPAGCEGAAYAEIPGLSRRGPEGEILTSPKGPRIKDLDTIPSAYLSGVLDPLVLSKPGQKWVGIWETNRGCPFSCSFCDWGSAVASKVYPFARERLDAEMHWFARHRIDAIYCIDSNFGMLSRDLELTEAVIAVKQQHGFPRVLYTQTAKNVTERAYTVQKRLMEAGMNWVATLSLQSVSPAALKAIKRDNISLETYRELQRRFRRDGVPTYTDYLVGLPGETFESFIQGIGTVIAQGQHREMRNWNTFILPNAELADPDYRARYGIESVTIPLRSWQQPAEEYPDGIVEYQEMLVATSTYHRDDWVRMRVFAWLTQVLYFGGALQLPMMLIHELAGVPYEKMLLAFLEGELPAGSAVLSHLRAYLLTRAREMAAGGPEYTAGFEPSKQQMVWMAPDYFASIHLLYSPRLDALFAESQALLQTFAGNALPEGLLAEALTLSRAIYETQRPESRQFNVTLSWNLWECYQQVLAGEPVSPRKQPQRLFRYQTQGVDTTVSQPLSFK